VTACHILANDCLGVPSPGLARRDDAGMGWKQHARSWTSWTGLGIAVAGLTAVPEIAKHEHIPGPAWVSPTFVAAAGVALAAGKLLLTAHTDVAASRAKARAERSGSGEDALAVLITSVVDTRGA
jgi:hypothetical protein